MKKAYIAILTIFTIACIIFGTLFHTGSLFRWNNGFIYKIITSDAGEIADFSQSYSEEISKLDIDLSTMNLKVKQGDALGVEYRCGEKLVPTITISDGKMTIRQSSRNISLNGNVIAEMTIVIPKRYLISELTVAVDAGNVEISDLSASKVDLDVDAGKISLDTCFFEDSAINVDAGNAQLHNCSVDYADADVNMGNLELTDCAFLQLEGSVDMGNISVDSVNDLESYTMDFEVDMGNLSINGRKQRNNYHASGSSDNKISLCVDMGNIEVKY